MSLIEWSNEWTIGHKVIDYDHQMLVNITNQVYDIRRLPKIRVSEVKKTLDHLVQYVEQHFAREEEIFKKTKYPLCEQHIAMHRELEKVVRDISFLYQKDPDLLNFDEILEFLRRWLIDHILKHDKGYAKYLP